MKAWTVTPWKTNPDGSWAGIQPVVLVEGEPPFTADTPAEYVCHLRGMLRRDDLEYGAFHTRIGEFQDEMERVNALSLSIPG